MTQIVEFPLPDLGEGLTEGEILRWFVGVGDQVRLNQPIVEVETAKAAVEIPSPYAGTVVAIPHEVGDVVETGASLITFDTDPASGGQNAADADAGAKGAGSAPVSGPAEGVTPLPPAEGEKQARGSSHGDGQRQAVLVGYGPRTGQAQRRPRKPAENGSTQTPSAQALLPTIPDELTVGTKPVRHGGLELGRAVEQAKATAPVSPPPMRSKPAAELGPVSGDRVLAKPPVRKFARDLGVDLTQLQGTGSGGVITREDVERATVAVPRVVGTTAMPMAGEPTERGAEERIAIRGVRKATADAMVSSAFTAPHVTCFLDVDMTATMELITKLREAPEFADVRVGPLIIAAKAVVAAIRRQPSLNSTWDEDAGEIVIKHYVNLGIAAATERGLIVPNVKNAHALSTVQLAAAVSALAETARAGKTSPADMSGGTFTITNIGVFGVDTGTPIIPPGESAILALGAVSPRPWVIDGQVVARQVCTLALSFDHRVVDGEQGSKFLADIGRFLTNPAAALVAWS